MVLFELDRLPKLSRDIQRERGQRRRLFLEHLEDRRVLADLAVILQLFDTSNVAIANPVNVGTEVVLQARVRDARTPAFGVAATYLDLTFPNLVSQVANSVTHGADFNTLPENGTLAGNTLTDIGGSALNVPSAATAGNEFVLFSVRFTANSIGTGNFTAILGDSQTLLSGLFPSTGFIPIAPTDVTFTPASLTVQATPPERVANADNPAAFNEDSGAQVLNVLGNDTGTGLQVTSITQPTNGLATITNGGTTVTYTPNLNFNGADSFTYTLNNGLLVTDTATVNLNVTAVNDPPTASNLNAAETYTEDTPLNLVDIAASDVDSANVTATLTLSNAAAGSLNTGTAGAVTSTFNAGVWTANGPIADVNALLAGLIFTPSLNFNSTFSIATSISDGLASAIGSKTFTGTAVNDAPDFTIPATAAAVNEDAGLQTVNGFATGIIPGPATATDEAGQTVLFTATIASTTGNLTFSSPPAISPSGVLTYTPTANSNGTATINVSLKDNGLTANGGVDTSATKTFTITVNGVDDAPVFNIAANPVAVNEDAGAQNVPNFATGIGPGGGADEAAQTLSFLLTPGAVTGNLAFSSAPTISPTGVLTYTPAANTNGTATFSVVLQDNGTTANGGVNTSAAQNFTITVNAVNDAPDFTIPATAPAVDEDAGLQTLNAFATGIIPGPATATDEAGQTVQFTTTIASTTGNLTFSSPPTISPSGVLTYTPAANSNGTATINVSLKDNGLTANGGVDTSATKTFTITVNPVNDPPVANPQSVSVVLNVAKPITLTGSDVENSALTFNVVNGPNGGVLTGTAPNLTYTPNNNFLGNDSFTFTVNDGNLTSAPATVSISVAVDPANDAPVNTAPASITVLEDTTVTFTAANLISIADADAGTAPVRTTLTIPAGAGVLNLTAGSATVTGNGSTSVQIDGTLTQVNAALATLTYAPAANRNNTTAGGPTNLQVVTNDLGNIGTGGAQQDSDTIAINLTAVNDAPDFAVPANVTVNEDAAAQSVVNFATGIIPGPATATDEVGQTAAFTVTQAGAATGNLAFTTPPAIGPTGTLTYTLAPNTNGTATFNVTLQDNGGTANNGANTSSQKTFTITVNAVNDVPDFTIPTPPPTVNEDAGAQTLANFATNIIPGGGSDEAGQTFTFNLTAGSTTGNLAFTTAPAISSTGTLTYTAAPNTNGTAVFSVTVQDNGGTANGGVNTSTTKTFTISVNAVNDAPSFTIAANPATINEDAGAQTVANFVTAIGTGGGSDETSQTLTFSLAAGATTGNLAFSVAPTISSNGTLTYTPAPNTNGTASFTVTLQDSGGTANGGVNAAATRNFTITVNAVNDAPDFTIPTTAAAVNEDAGAQTVNGFATGIIPGPATATDETTQTLNFTTTVGTTTGTLTFATPPAISSAGVLTYTPTANTNGTATINVSLKDSGLTANGGVDTSATKSFTITVNAVNDAPAFTIAAAPPTVNEDAGAQTVANFITGIGVGGGTDEATQTVSFTLAAGATTGNLTFSTPPTISPTGTLTYTPTANTNGTASFTVTMQDSGGTANGGQNAAATQTFTITVNAVNDVPSFTLAGNPPAVAANSGIQTIANFATNISRGGGTDEAAQGVNFILTAGATTGGLLFSTPPAISSTGVLTYTTQGTTAGTATFTVSMRDDGGTANGGVDTTATQSFTITVGLSTLSGFVYCDINGNGARDTNELGLPNVVITLTGTDSANAAVSRTTTTGADGSYSFGSLLPGTYAVTETHPTAFIDGPEQLGSLGGTVGSDTITAIVLSGSAAATNYNFSELGLTSAAVGMHLFLCSTPGGAPLGQMLIPAAPQPLRAAPAAIAAKSAANQSVAPRSSLALASSSTQQPLRITAVQPVVREAIQRFSRLGITPVQQAKLAAVEVQIADLPGDELGSTTGNQITLDTTAAELGWFIDPTPDNDSEFAGSASAPEGIDLFTVISHELGHVLGLEHDVLNGDDLQDEFLNVGVRKSPTPELIDQLLAQDDAWDLED